jgi:hypothetical protein
MRAFLIRVEDMRKQIMIGASLGVLATVLGVTACAKMAPESFDKLVGSTDGDAAKISNTFDARVSNSRDGLITVTTGAIKGVAKSKDFLSGVIQEAKHNAKVAADDKAQEEANILAKAQEQLRVDGAAQTIVNNQYAQQQASPFNTVQRRPYYIEYQGRQVNHSFYNKYKNKRKYQGSFNRRYLDEGVDLSEIDPKELRYDSNTGQSMEWVPNQYYRVVLANQTANHVDFENARGKVGLVRANNDVDINRVTKTGDNNTEWSMTTTDVIRGGLLGLGIEAAGLGKAPEIQIKDTDNVRLVYNND